MRNPLNEVPPRRFLIFGVAAILLASSGIAGLTIWMPAAAYAVTAAAAVPESPDDASPVERNCSQCGVVTSTREIGQSAPDTEGVPSGLHEVTVRVNDGSNRMLTHATTATWRVGERLILIAGANSVRN